jgi:Leucine-rich repeat (LRR) protein
MQPNLKTRFFLNYKNCFIIRGRSVLGIYVNRFIAALALGSLSFVCIVLTAWLDSRTEQKGYIFSKSETNKIGFISYESNNEWLATRLPRRFRQLTLHADIIRLKGTRWTDSEIMNLEGLSYLRWLSIRDTSVSDAGLVYLRGLHRLEQLRISGKQFDDLGLKNIQSLQSLSVLGIVNSSIKGPGLDYISNAAGIRRMELPNSQIDDNGLRHIARFAELRVLALSANSITDDGLSALAGLTQLTDLNLSETQISGNGLKHFEFMKGLVDLDLSHTPLTDSAVAPLSRLTSLHRLSLEGTRLTALGLKELKRALPNTEIDDPDIGHGPERF